MTWNIDHTSDMRFILPIETIYRKIEGKPLKKTELAPPKNPSTDHLHHVFPWDLEALGSADSNTNHLAIQVMLVEMNNSLISLI